MIATTKLLYIVSKVGRMVVCCYSHWYPSLEGERTATVKSGFLFVTSGWKELLFCYIIYWYPSGRKGDEERVCYSYWYPLWWKGRER